MSELKLPVIYSIKHKRKIHLPRKSKEGIKVYISGCGYIFSKSKYMLVSIEEWSPPRDEFCRRCLDSHTGRKYKKAIPPKVSRKAPGYRDYTLRYWGEKDKTKD